jgi:multidrug efflux pump subunit AcrB
VWLLRPHERHGPAGASRFERLQQAFGGLVELLVRGRRIVIPAYLVICGLILWQVGTRLGTELFPQVDSGEFVLRFRAPPGSNYEVTRQIAGKTLPIIEDEAGKDNVDISMGFAGQQAPVYALNNLILFMRGPDDGMLRVALREGSGVKLPWLRQRLRQVLPERLKPWLRDLLKREGLTQEQAEARASQIGFGFQPGDVVSEVMSFGSPTPIEIVVACPDLAEATSYARRVKAELEKVKFLRDVQFHQSLAYPTVPVVIDRDRTGLSGLTVADVAGSVLVATSSSRYAARNYWRDPKSGVDYQVEVLVPTRRMNSAQQVATLPIHQVNADLNLLVRDVALVRTGSMPGEIDRSTMQRYVSVTANVEGEDLGRAAGQIERALGAAGTAPRGVRVEVRGQVAPMREMFRSLGIGLAIAVFVILVMLTAYFESPRLALASIGSVPGVLSGVVLALYLTGTTVNVESFMGTIMCIGVSVSNSVMLVTFMGRAWREGQPSGTAAKVGAEERLRPILMTACAMTVGMVPMALALEAGSEMQAPLGRAVIGGLVMSTFATLLIVPPLFALLLGKRQAISPSVCPDDLNSAHYHPPEKDAPKLRGEAVGADKVITTA